MKPLNLKFDCTAYTKLTVVRSLSKEHCFNNLQTYNNTAHAWRISQITPSDLFHRKELALQLHTASSVKRGNEDSMYCKLYSKGLWCCVWAMENIAFGLFYIKLRSQANGFSMFCSTFGKKSLILS